MTSAQNTREAPRAWSTTSRTVNTRQIKAVHRPTTLGSDVRRNALWNMAATMLLRLSSIGVMAIVARIMDPHAFGIFAVASTVFVIVSAIGEFGVSSCLARADLDIERLAPTMVSVSLITGCAVAGITFVYARPIAAALGSADAAGPVRVLTITIVLASLFATPTAQCVRDFRQDKIFLANAISTIPSTVLLLVLAKSGSGAMAFAWSRAFGQLIAGSIVVYYTPKSYPPGMTRYALSVLFKFGIPLSAANFVGYILQNIDYALIGRLMGTVILGTYVLAFNMASWSTTLLGGVMNGVSLPAFSRVKHDPVLLKENIITATRAVALIVLPMCTLVIVLARPLVLLMYGSRWQEAATVVPILTIYGVISVMCLLFSSMLAALGKTRVILGVQLLWLVALAIAMWIGVRRNGIVGAATAHVVVVSLLVLPCYLFALRRATGVRITRVCKAVLPATVAAVLAALVSWMLVSRLSTPLLQVLGGGLVGSLAYLSAMLPQAVILFRRDLLSNRKVRRIMRFYHDLGSIIGLEIGVPSRHGTRHRRTTRIP
jgi:lipopolysaccharide exporter